MTAATSRCTKGRTRLPLLDPLIEWGERSAFRAFSVVVPESRARGLSVRLASLVRFGVGGCLSLGLNMLVTILLHEVLSVAPAPAYAVGLATVTGTNFLLCRHWVFGDGGGCWAVQGVGYVVFTCLFRGLEFLSFLLLNGVLGVHYAAAIVLVGVLFFLVKHEVYGRVLFARSASVNE